MTALTERRRGQPLAVLASILALWVMARSLLWQSPFPEILQLPDLPDLPDLATQQDGYDKEPARSAGAEPGSRSTAVGMANMAGIANWPTAAQTFDIGGRHLLAHRTLTVAERDVGRNRVRSAASHQLLWLAAMAHVPITPGTAHLTEGGAAVRRSPGVAKTVRTTRSRASRWSFDGWLYLREGQGLTASAGQFPASYGASQAGAVLRYRLSNFGNRKPTAYVRATKALSGGGEGDVAAGLSARPFADVPVAAHAELRAGRNTSGTEIRPAAMLVTELPAYRLPLDVRATAYAQAGYVGGDFATPFADGQVRVDRELASVSFAGENVALRGGAGVWGGAQKGASRLDIGPTASVDLSVGNAPARLAVDYRYRVMGNAQPGSGFALTLSTGF